MTKSLVTLVVAALLFAASAAAQTQTAAAAAPPATRVLTADGSVLHGAITGGTVTVKTTFGGELRVEARRLQTVQGTTVTLDDGSVLHGTLGAGSVQLTSAFGTLSIPVDRVTEVQNLKTAAVTPPPAPPPAAARPTAPPPPKAVVAKPTTAAVQFVNETRRSLNVCLNEETPCLQLGPLASTTRTLSVGPLRVRVESTTTLGFVVLATGSFERSVPVDADSVVRIAENDFR